MGTAEAFRLLGPPSPANSCEIDLTEGFGELVIQPGNPGKQHTRLYLGPLLRALGPYGDRIVVQILTKQNN